MRKKEKEYERLQATLQQYVAERKVASKRASELLGTTKASSSGTSKLPRTVVPATPLRNKQSARERLRRIGSRICL